MLADILLALAIVYSVKIVIFGIAAFNARYPSNPSYRPSVSIVIAARNEEKNIRQCLESMVRLSYPTNLLEIVVVDDGSEDCTADIAREYVSRFNHVRLHTAAPGIGNLKGKTNAVTQGIEVSHGEILLFTDADCSVPIHWVEGTVKYYTDPSIGVVAGFTALRVSRWFEAIQALDWFVLFSVAAATIRLKYPVTAVGNNLSVRREAYNKVGGYRNIPFSVTEDYALFHAIACHPGYTARFPLDYSTLVESDPCKGWKELYRQKKRWFTGGKGMDVRSLLVFTIPFVFNLVLLLSVLFAPSQSTFCAAILKTTADLFLAIPSVSRFKRWSLLRYFPVFELYYTSYVLLFPIVVLFGNEVVWKDRTFRN
jgi:cellulose synthase/poly-beta-1,6-N-acetylglucosamine synthase-like glycosyltransferase